MSRSFLIFAVPPDTERGALKGAEAPQDLHLFRLAADSRPVGSPRRIDARQDINGPLSIRRLLCPEPGHGVGVPPALAEDFARKLQDCRLVKLGDGIHFLQEDHPETIGLAVAAFIAEVESLAGKSAA